MITDNIVLFETQGKYILVDNCTYNMFLLNKTSFEILQAIKKERSRIAVEKKFGKCNVDRVFNYIDSLKKKNAICDLTGNVFANNKEVVEGLNPKEPELVEGVFMLAQNCNMRCRYCYGDGGQFGNNGVMSKEMAKRYFMLFLRNQTKICHQKVKFLGGEPLLNFETMKYIVNLWEQLRNQFPEKRVTFSFTTNGTLFTPEIVQYIKENKIGVTISLDGSANIQNKNRRFHDGRFTYASVMDGIELLEKNDINFTIRATATSDIDLDELYEYFCLQNFKIVHIVPVDYPGEKKCEGYQWDFKQYRDYVNYELNLLSEGCENIINGNSTSFQAKLMNHVYKDLYERNIAFPFKCSAGWWSAVFSSDGYIYPCHRLVGNVHYRIGDYLNGIQAEKIKEIYLKILEVSNKCNTCIGLTTCKRRCMAQMALPDGSFTEIPEEMCSIYRDTYKHSVALFLKIRKFKEKGEKI